MGSQSQLFQEMEEASDLESAPIDKSYDTMKDARQQRKKNKLASHPNYIGNLSQME